MALDQARYEEEVVRPLRGRTAQLPDDLPTRYAVDPGMARPDLERRLREVRAYWTQKASRPSYVGQVCQAFLRADAELRREHDLADPAFWRRRARGGQQTRRRAVEGLAGELRGFYGDLGRLTEEQLAAAAAAHPDVVGDQATQAAVTAGLTVVPARELPREPGVPPDVARAITDGLAAAGVASVPALLHPGHTRFTLLDRFSATPPVRGGLDAAAVDARSEAVSRGADTAASGPTKQVLGRLRTAARQGVDLRVLSLVLLLAPVRAQKAAGAVPSGLVRRLESAGLDPDEARRLVVHVLAETTAPPTDPAGDARALLAAGRPVAAGRLLTGLEGDDAGEVRRLLEARAAEVDALRAEAAEALRTGRPELAEQRLAAALGIAADREDLAAELARVPPAPVTRVDAAPDGTGVRVSWTAPPSHGADVVHRVLRRTDRAPGDAEDGTVVASGSGTHAAADASPPVGRTVHYAVLAGRAEGTAWSDAVTTSLTVVPPVTDLEVVGDHGAVVGRWRAHPDVVGVRVRRFEGPATGSGTEIPATTRGFTDDTAVEGVEYHYEVVVRYVAGDRELVSDAVVVRGGIRADSAPVEALHAAPEQDGGDVRLRVGWRTPRGADVEIRVARTAPPGQVGDLLTAAEVEAWGPVVEGVPRHRDGWDGLLATVPAGRVHVAAFTRAPAGRVRGAAVVSDLVPAPSQLRAQPGGESVVLSWVWPADVAVAEVRWPGGEERVTRARYRDRGGVTLPAGVAGTVEVRGVVGSGPDRSLSTPVTTEVAAPARRVRYTLALAGSRWRGTRQCVVSVPSAQGSGSVEVVLVATEGRTMPLSPSAGIELARHTVELSAPEPAVFTAPLPRLRRPFWLRCFSGRDGVVLVDPSVATLKVP